MKRMRSVSLAVFSMVVGLAGQSFAGYRTWTNSEGVKIEAEFVKAEGGNVTLRLKSGKSSTFSDSKLSPEDQEFIKTAASTAPSSTSKPAEVAADRNAKWVSKMDRAKKEAEETGLPILVLFTGTEWCPYCIKLEKEVFAEKAFKEFADKQLVLLKMEFGPGGKSSSKADGELAKEFGVKGYPKYFLIDASGKKLAQGGYHGGINPEQFATWVNGAKAKKLAGVAFGALPCRFRCLLLGRAVARIRGS